jgi:hypothetical protein
MESYKRYFIDGSALMTHPFRRDWYVCADVFVQGRGTSLPGVTRSQLQRFTVDIKELAEWFGLEIARIVVDECLPERES